MPNTTHRRHLPIKACSLNNNGLQQLYRLLQQKVDEAANYEVSKLNRLDTQSDQDFVDMCELVRDAFRISVQITTEDGEVILAEDDSFLDDINLPNNISLVQFDSGYNFRNISNNSQPKNHFTVTLDFNKQRAFDNNNPATAPLVNKSALECWGEDPNWVIAVHDRAKNFFSDRKIPNAWLHHTNTYDILLILLGFPIGFWVLYRVLQVANSELGEVPLVLGLAILVYVFVVWLFFFRVIFFYARWAWPLVEFSGATQSPNKYHRSFWKFLAGGLLIALVWDVITSVF